MSNKVKLATPYVKQFIDLSEAFPQRTLSAIIERYTTHIIKHKDNVLLSTISNEGSYILVSHTVTDKTPPYLNSVGVGVLKEQKFKISALENIHEEISTYLKDLSLFIYLQKSYQER